jgi:uroporphyrinogen decarboxylase
MMDVLRSILKMKVPGPRKPDFEGLRQALTSNQPGPVRFGDLFADYDFIGAYLNEPIWHEYLANIEPGHRLSLGDLKGGWKFIDQNIRFYYQAGFDYVPSNNLLSFPGVSTGHSSKTESDAQDGRPGWVDSNHGPITSWDDFERYPWPANIRLINLLPRLTAKRAPDGMKVMAIPGGVFESTTSLMGLVPFSYALADQPELVDAVIGKVSGIIYRIVEDIISEPNVGGIFMADDWGYSSGTLISPRVLREKIMPPTRSIVELAHSAGKLVFLHSCGNLKAIMDDIIAMGVDAKHSFEDKIMPVEEVHALWGDKLGIIGGVDMDLLARGSEKAVRERTRQILDACASRGRYVLGTGNSVTSFIPVRNYRAMLDETRRWNLEHYGREY